MIYDRVAEPEPAVVLVVDDDAFVGRAVACILHEARQAQVYLARTADQALPLATAVCPDLILTDVQMPGMTALELCLGLRAGPSTWDTPIYLLTGVLSGNRSLEGLAQHVQGVLSKPPDPVELIAIFDRVCG